MLKQFITLLFVFCCLGVVSGQADERKNILFIAVDDLKPLLSNYGYEQMKTPNFDRLAKMGVSFSNAHVQYAVCGPSRASIMTGVFPDETGVHDLHTDFRESGPDLHSMPEYLIGQGYATTAVGKIYHKGSSSKGHDGESWSIPHSLPKNFDAANGAPAFYYYQNPDNKAKIAALEKEAKAKGISKHGKLRKYVFDRHKPSTESADVPDDAYQDGLYAREAIKKMNKLAKGDQPFFLGVGFQKPHLPFVAPKKYWDLYERDEIMLSPVQELADGTPARAYHSFGEIRSYTDIDSKLRAGDAMPEAKQRELIHGYMACVSYVDALIGRLLDALEENELMDNTVIVLWGDHGFHLGDHTMWCKHSNFEQATRIPLMFAGPGVEAGKMEAAPVNLVDVFPTLFDLAGVAADPQASGKSLVPLLDGNVNTGLEQDYAISQYARSKNQSMGYSLRTERYRYTEWHENGYQSSKAYDRNNVGATELYDYETDPLETRNLVNDPAYKSIVGQLQDKLRQHLETQMKRSK